MILKKESLAALITTILTIIFIIIPLLFLGIQLFKESSQLYQSLTGENGGGFVKLIESAIHESKNLLPFSAEFEINFEKYIKQGLEILIQNLGTIFSSLAKFLLNSFVFLIALYFFLKDGNKLKNYFIALSPLDDKNDKIILSRLKLAISSAVKGNLTIGIIQGSLTGIGFAIFGVPNAVLFGAVAAIAALLPGVGTALVIIPAIIFLFFTGNIFNGIGLMVWGATAVGLIDNLLGPRLIGRGMNLHPLAVFISVLGGLSFFGPLGFLLGPLTLSICIGLIDIYFTIKKDAPFSE